MSVSAHRCITCPKGHFQISAFGSVALLNTLCEWLATKLDRTVVRAVKVLGWLQARWALRREGKGTARSMKSFIAIRNSSLNFVMEFTGVRGQIVLLASHLTGIATRLESGELSLASFFLE